MHLFLARDVHAAQVANDLVFLDVAADAYFCLGGAAEVIALGPGGEVVVNRDQTAGQLLEAGLLSHEAPPARTPPPPRPLASIRLDRPAKGPSLRTRVTALRVTLSVARRFRRRSFAELVAGPRPAQAAWGEPSADLIEAVGTFERLRPWLPLDGECLLRSYHLRTFLRASGLDALWVFGVRTWPFGAHCWLQAGRTVLDDDLERLAAYQPILAA